MNALITATATITTHDYCSICQSPSRVTHGFRSERGSPMHIENCPECGELWAVVGYDCPQCAEAMRREQAPSPERAR